MSTVRVTFLDASRNTEIAQAELPAEQLPETFELETSLQLGGRDWTVERAEPLTRAEYVASGTLRIALREIKQVDPKEILFSLPTLENTQPELTHGNATGAYAMHEDDWRQCELIAGDFDLEIKAEVADIEAARETRKGPGFAHLHVRQRIPNPLGRTVLTIDELAKALGNPPRRACSINNRMVANGFAFSVGSAVVYGHTQEGTLACIAVTDPVAELAELARAHSLVLVDWCAPAVLDPARGFVRA